MDVLNCPRSWPPLMTTGKPHAGRGLKASLLGTIHRKKPAGLQVTYAGHPLYRYNADKAAGDVLGQAFYSSWYVLAPSGHAIKKKP